MADDAGGNATRPPGNIPATGQTAQAAQVNVPVDDIYASLTRRLMRDGRAPMLGNLQMNGYRATGAAEGTEPDDYVTLSQIPGDSVRYTAQTLEAGQQTQARNNIGAASTATATTLAAGLMGTGDKTKLDGVAAGAQVNPNAAAIKASYESNANTNAFTDALLTKLNGIAAGATVGPTIPTSSTLSVGAWAYVSYNSGTSLADGATTAGSNVRTPAGSTSTPIQNTGANQTGTWRNISGGALISSGTNYGLMVRTA